MLLPDPQDRTYELLTAIINATQGHTTSVSVPVESFSPSSSAIIINLLFFVALFLSLGAALGAMLVKQWTRQYGLSLRNRSMTWQRARERHRKYKNLHKWRLEDIVAWLPLLLHVALLLFGIATLMWVKLLHRTIYISLIIFCSLGAIAYLIFALIPAFSTHAPFIWPVSSTLRAIFTPFRRSVDEDLEGGNREDTPPLAYLATPEPHHLLYSRQIKPPNHTKEDASMLMHLLCETDAHDEQDATMDALIKGRWQGVSMPSLIMKNEQLLFQRYLQLAASCWDNGHLSPRYLDRARRLCRFIEWVYYQLSVEQRRTLRSWPDELLATALIKDTQDGYRLDDIVLSSSITSKLHHVRLDKNSPCSVCWSKERDRTIYMEIVMGSEDVHSKKMSEVEHLQDLMVSCIWSDTDCIVHYAQIKDTCTLRLLTRESLRNLLKSFAFLKTSHDQSYRNLGSLMGKMVSTLEDSDPRMEWFRAIRNVQEGNEISEISCPSTGSANRITCHCETIATK